MVHDLNCHRVEIPYITPTLHLLLVYAWYMTSPSDFGIVIPASLIDILMKFACYSCLSGEHSSQAASEVKSASQEKPLVEKPSSLIGTK